MPTAQEMLAAFDRYAVGHADMDHTHREFLLLCIETLQAQGPAFAEQFVRLFEHTRAHFAEEEARMQASAFPALLEHRADHQRTLGDMDRFAQRAAAGRGSMARAWLSESLPQWFALHARTMDSALAAHLTRT